MYILIFYFQITVAPVVASFTNAACTTGGVNPTEPLLFTCEVYKTFLLRIVLPTGDQEVVSVGDTADDVSLPTGFTAVSLDITEIDKSTRNFNISISIGKASNLGGGEITCDDTTSRNQASASCPIFGKLNYSINPVVISEINTSSTDISMLHTHLISWGFKGHHLAIITHVQRGEPGDEANKMAHFVHACVELYIQCCVDDEVMHACMLLFRSQ